MANKILTQWIRNPKTGSDEKWLSPFYISDDEQIHFTGILDTEDAVQTDNIKDDAITFEKLNAKIFTIKKLFEHDSINSNIGNYTIKIPTKFVETIN